MTAELIERLERGEVGREIDRNIWLALNPGLNIRGWPSETYTTSLDAAIALVERVRPGWFWDVSKVFPSGNMRAGLTPPPIKEGEHWLREIGAIAFASTPAAALIAALLKAEAK